MKTKTVYRGLITCVIICVLCALISVTSVVLIYVKPHEVAVNVEQPSYVSDDIFLALSAEKIVEEPIVIEEEKETPAKTNRYSELEITEEDKELLARIVYLEARGQSFSGQRAVAEVVLNRVLDSRFPDTIYEVLYAPGQFTPAKSIASTTPTKTQYEVVDCVIDETPITTENTVYFATSALTKNVFAKIGDHYFCEG